jgi:cytochrome P450
MNTSVPCLPLPQTMRIAQGGPVHLFTHIQRCFGDIGAFHVPGARFTVLSGPEYAQALFVDHASDVEPLPKLRTVYFPLTGDGSLYSPPTTYKAQSKLVAPLFTRRQIASHAEVMVEHTQQHQAQWQDGAQIDVAREMMQLALRIVGTTLFGTDLLAITDRLGYRLTGVLRTMAKDTVAVVPFLRILPTPRRYRFWNEIRYLKSIADHMVHEHRIHPPSKLSLLTLLLRAQQEQDLSEDYIRSEVMTYLIAGHETTAIGLAWTWYLLAKHPAIYARVQAEVDQVLGGRPPTPDDLPRLPYTLQVFKETLRLYPPAYAISRQTLRPIQLGAYTLPKGAPIFFCSYNLHRRADVFPNPHLFDPDRFAPGKEQQWPKYAYLPFGAGPRTCIGNHFATIEAHLILTTLVQHVAFELIPDQTIEPEPLITLRPKYGVRAIVRRRPS